MTDSLRHLRRVRARIKDVKTSLLFLSIFDLKMTLLSSRRNLMKRRKRMKLLIINILSQQEIENSLSSSSSSLLKFVINIESYISFFKKIEKHSITK